MSPSSRGWAGGPRSRYGKELRQPIQIFWPTTASEAEFGLSGRQYNCVISLAANRFDFAFSRTQRGSAKPSVVSHWTGKLPSAWSWMQEELALWAFTARVWL